MSSKSNTAPNDFFSRKRLLTRQSYAAHAVTPRCAPLPMRTEQVIMDDGIALSTDIYAPDAPGPFPTIVVRCPYPEQVPLWAIHGEELSRRGYALVCQWCRGTYTSQGVWEPNVNERADGLALLEWLQGQPWVDCIGLWGTSYVALTALVTADIAPEKVRSICISHYGTDRYISAYENGIFHTDVLTAWAMNNAGRPVRADYLQSARHRPQISVDEDLWGCHLDWYRDWISHPDSDDPYWSQGFWGTLKQIPANIRIPVYLQEGWYDHHLRSALAGFAALDSETRRHSWLDIGCWDHYFANPLQDMDPRNLLAIEKSIPLDWFELTLRHKLTPEQRVSYYEIFDDQWHTVPDWPPRAESDLAFALSPAEQGPEHRLLNAVPETMGTLEYAYDPDDPVPTLGGENLLHSRSLIGSKLQPTAGYRDDVISFVSDPISSDMHILGSPEIRLFVSSSAPDTAFTAKLMILESDGKARNLRNAITTISSTEKDGTYHPGDICELVIGMSPISFGIRAGDRIRLDISSSDFPQYAVHTNTAGLWCQQSVATIARQRIHCGGTNPSRMILPISAPSQSTTNES